ncbi:MAG: triple tyrosine motif-containing protein [Candidatus Delongbacteria bacterium]|jgi:ligand-binding sensor domain-containing protein/two-component sensor histidine kinase|nr:triple tyrosine motif-containing protein [Candidatus Delongbacteria bacterium]
MKKYFITISLFLTSFLLYTQIKVHRHLTTEMGLIQPDICAIHEDSSGYMWFATMGGITRWDGINFLSFYTSDGLPASQIYDIFEDEDGKVYFPTYGGGSVEFKDGKMVKAFKYVDQFDIDLAAMDKDLKGNYYFGGYDGITMFSKNNEAIYLDSVNSVWNINKGKDGSLYFGTYKVGVKVLKDGKFTELNIKNGLIDNAVWKVVEDTDRNLHIGTNKGVSVYQNNKFKFLGKENDVLSSRITGIYQTADETIYYGGVKGVTFKDEDKWKYLTKENGLSANDTWSIYQDSYGQIYFGSAGGGVNIYRPGIFENYDISNGLSGNIVQSIYEDENGTYYFGTENGVSVLKDGKFTYLNSENGLLGNKVRDITGDKKGKIFIGTRSGLNILDNGKIIQLNSKDGLIDDQIFSLLFASDNSLYICTKKGVSALKNGKISNFSKKNGMADDYVQYAYENSKGEIEFGTYLGVVVKNGDTFKSISTKDGLNGLKIFSIYEDKESRKYYGTYGKGLNIFDKGKNISLDPNNGLSSSTIGSIQEDDSGNIYIATGQGIDILTFVGDSIKIRNIDQSDGLISNGNFRDASFKDSKGKIWFGTTKGVSCYDPAADKEIKIPPKVHFNEIRIFDDIISSDNNEFEYDQNFITFNYIGIYLPSPNKVMYKLRLNGLEDNWELTGERRVRYTGLAPGKYSFEVKAVNNWGYWSDPISYDFTILPPWWMTWWFRTIAVLTGIFLLRIFYKARINKILQVERLRTKIAGDLHDEIGSSLTGIFMSTESIQRSKDEEKINKTAKKIGVRTKELMHTFSDIVWSIESRNDTLGEISDRMEEFVFKMSSDCDMIVKYGFSGLNRDKKISSELRQNLYLIFKEALNNSIKYSKAKKIDVSLIQNNRSLELKVIDNGNGFADKKQSFGGHGIKSMKIRAEKIGGVLNIVENGGVTVHVTININ